MYFEKTSDWDLIISKILTKFVKETNNREYEIFNHWIRNLWIQLGPRPF